MLAQKVGEHLRQKSMLLVLAESCTGGLISNMITNIAGSSDYFLGGVVSYANEVKVRVLGVDPGTIERYGAVSEQTSLEMANGVRHALGRDFSLQKVIGLSVTGIAGPGGSLPDKPVGTTWIALCTPQGSRAFLYTWTGNRAQNKRSSAHQALTILEQYLTGVLPIFADKS